MDKSIAEQLVINNDKTESFYNFRTALMQDHRQLFSKDNASLTIELFSEMAESVF